MHQWGRVCLNCGSFRTQRSQFCTFCETALWERSFFPRSFCLSSGKTSILVRSLFLWEKDQNRALSVLIDHLKGGGPSAAYDFFGHLLAHEVSKNLEAKDDPILIPVPSRYPKKKDHAWCLAEAISQKSGIPMRTPLTRDMSAPRQKTLGRKQRTALRIQSDEKFTASRCVILVDDVVTTGSTAMASFKALGSPPRSRLLTIAYRSLVAGGGGL